MSLPWFSRGFSILVKLDFAALGFIYIGRKTGAACEKPLQEDVNQLQTQPQYGVRLEWNESPRSSSERLKGLAENIINNSNNGFWT